MRPFLPKPAKRGRKPTTDLREVLNAIRYMARSGAGWRMLPKDFPPSGTVYGWFRRFVRRFLFETIHDMAVMIDRERVGREASPSAGVIDSQSVKAPGAEVGGCDAGKKIVARSWTKPPTRTSRLRRSGASTARKASRSCRDDGWSNEPSDG
jgi:putative transposase